MRSAQVLFIATAWLAAPAAAHESTVPNASFEAPEVFDNAPAIVTGDGDAATVPGWIFGIEAGTPIGGVADPTDSQYVGASGNNAPLLPPADGGQSAFLEGTLTGDAATLTTNMAFGEFAPDHYYLLTVAVGNPADGVPGDLELAVLADGVELASAPVAAAEIADESFLDVPLRFTTDYTDLFTQRLIAIELRHTVNEDAVQTIDLDNVRLAHGTVAGTQSTVDELIMNRSTNDVAQGDQPPGLVVGSSVASSPLFNGAFETTDAFGATDGSQEPGNVVFQDNHQPDNGNAVLGDGGEWVDFIEWNTLTPVSSVGYVVGVDGNGDRTLERVRFLIGGVVVDFFDADGESGHLERFFEGPERFNELTGTDFRIEFTRTNATGPRVFEINAVVVPEPHAAALALAALAVLGVLSSRSMRVPV
jgi:hypothetical protein